MTLKGGVFYAEPVNVKGSGSISTMAQSNGFMVVFENREGIGKGEAVIVYMFGDVEVA